MGKGSSVIYYLPYPISTNRYWRNYRGRTVRSKEAVAYKEQVAWANLGTRHHKPISDSVAVVVTLHPKLTAKGVASKTVMDLDNCLKVTLDALQGVAYDNDAQIKAISVCYGDAVKDGGVTVKVSPVGCKYIGHGVVYEGEFLEHGLLK
jgi:crossover junction endodeoxyribonuclease RusA